ncbi:hypothetical protein KI387_021616, partial [Taxus chinensis]
NLTSLALYLSPMATFWGIYKLRSNQEYSGLPYVRTLFTCALWLLYGAPFVKPHSTLLLTVNGAGFVLEIFYVLSFLIFASEKTKGLVIKTKSVEYMPFLPSLFNTLNTLVWSGYSVISRDIFLAQIPKLTEFDTVKGEKRKNTFGTSGQLVRGGCKSAENT